MAVSDDGGPASNSLGTVERPVLYGGGPELRGGPRTSERPTVAEWRRQASMEEHAVARVRERDPRCMVMVGHDRAVWLLGCCFSASFLFLGLVLIVVPSMLKVWAALAPRCLLRPPAATNRLNLRPRPGRAPKRVISKYLLSIR